MFDDKEPLSEEESMGRIIASGIGTVVLAAISIFVPYIVMYLITAVSLGIFISALLNYPRSNNNERTE